VKPDLEALESTIRSALSATLQSAEQPAVYTFGAELPRNSMGKLMDF
jgi:acyl-coenzyme A synthetase/AMP-(fatty) acid ligase